ncbi:MAG: response regulator [Chloroflexota bacterium]|jgi:two-component system cell cycle response regulator DivK
MRESLSPRDAHVLVVEANPPRFVSIARLLAHLGVIHCEWKTSGWQVVQFADTFPQLDLILMNIALPYEDGVQALRKMRGHPRLSSARVVALAEGASQEVQGRARAAMFDGLLSTPLDADRFPEQIRRLLAGEAVWE